MLHEIDQPVGQVKVGIHVMQLNASDDKAIDGMHSAVNRLLGHARQMTRESQQLFRVAFRTVVSRLAREHPDAFADAFFFDSILKTSERFMAVRTAGYRSKRLIHEMSSVLSS
jgi:hypothetical protein